MTRTSTLGLALVGLAALVPPAAANSCTCSDHHASYYQRSYYERAQRTAHYAHAPRYHRQTRYVVVERPRYETVYEVYGAEPEMVAPYEGEEGYVCRLCLAREAPSLSELLPLEVH